MKPILAISMGDPAGVGSEVVVRALAHPHIYAVCTPIVIGDKVAIQSAITLCRLPLALHCIDDPQEAADSPGMVDLIDLAMLKPEELQYKKVSPLFGRAAFSYIKSAIDLALAGAVDGVVTGPINKEAIHLAGYRYSGHTEIFADLAGAKHCAMVLATESLRVIHVTTHCSMREACDRIKKERVLTVIKLADAAMRMIGIEYPHIAVAGLNAHSSENGLFGDEERAEITPAIHAAREMGIQAEGPVPADTVFVKAMGGQYDIVVAMYHDQGHIPIKLSGYQLNAATNQFTALSGVNYTVGLPIIRTSVDHGTAFDRAGEAIANEQSMVEAILLAAKMARYQKTQ